MLEYQFQKLGTDCEIFLKDRSTGKPVPVIGLLGGTKKEPRPVLGGNGFAVQEDNVMPEFNIPPAEKIEEFVDNIDKMLQYLGMHFVEKGLFLDISPSQMFKIKELLHPQAKEIGCEPDYCAWTGFCNEIDRKNPLLKKLRTCGGHLHVSYLYKGCKPSEMENDPLFRRRFVVFQDATLGVASVILDNDKLRRNLYGKPGAFRPKPYGHEYRVLSNFWIKSKELTAWVFNQTQICFDWLNQGKTIDEEMSKEIQEIINTANVERAKSFCDNFGIYLP